MYHIVIYKKNASLKSQFGGLPISNSLDTTLHFCEQISNVYNLIKSNSCDLLLYFAEQLSVHDKIDIKSIQKKSPSTYITLLSQKSFAYDAWQLEVNNFDKYPVSLQQVRLAFQKLIQSRLGDKQAVLSIKQVDGTTQIPHHQIKYLQAQGNYTYIFYGENESILTSRQLGKYDFLCERFKGFARIHRSIIFNLNNISSIKGTSIKYNSSKTIQEVSKSLSLKLKKAIINE